MKKAMFPKIVAILYITTVLKGGNNENDRFQQAFE